MLVEPVEKTRADQIVLQNDTLTEGSDAGYLIGFEAIDIGAAIFELPEDADAFRI